MQHDALVPMSFVHVILEWSLPSLSLAPQVALFGRFVLVVTSFPGFLSFCKLLRNLTFVAEFEM